MRTDDIRVQVRRCFEHAPPESGRRSSWYAMLRWLNTLTEGNRASHQQQLERLTTQVSSETERQMIEHTLQLFQEGGKQHRGRDTICRCGISHR